MSVHKRLIFKVSFAGGVVSVCLHNPDIFPVTRTSMPAPLRCHGRRKSLKEAIFGLFRPARGCFGISDNFSVKIHRLGKIRLTKRFGIYIVIT